MAEPAKGICRHPCARTIHHELPDAAESELCRPRVHYGGGLISGTQAYRRGQGLHAGHRKGAGTGRLCREQGVHRHQRRQHGYDGLCPRRGTGCGRQGGRGRQLRPDPSLFLSRRLRRRAPRQKLLHGIRQADAVRHHGADTGLRQVPLQ